MLAAAGGAVGLSRAALAASPSRNGRWLPSQPTFAAAQRRGSLRRRVRKCAHFLPKAQRYVNGAGMGFFLGDAGFPQVVNDGLSFDFQLSGRLVDANLGSRRSLASQLFLVALAGRLALRLPQLRGLAARSRGRLFGRERRCPQFGGLRQDVVPASREDRNGPPRPRRSGFFPGGFGEISGLGPDGLPPPRRQFRQPWRRPRATGRAAATAN